MHRILPLFAVLSVAFAPAPLPKRVPDAAEAKQILGTWVGAHRVLIEPGRLTYNPDSSPIVYDLTIDPTTKPATYHVSDPGTNKPSFVGIYKIEGETLTFCYTFARARRPTAFDGPERGVTTEVYKRIKR